MRVLDVIDGVGPVLGRGELEVELHHRLRRPGEVEPADGVAADLSEQLLQGHKAPRALRHLALLEGHELVQDDLQPVGLEPERDAGLPHPGHVAVVVRAPDLDHAPETAALEAIDQVAEVGGEVGVNPVGPEDDPVVGFAALLVHRGREPGGSIPLLQESLLPQPLDRPRGLAFRPQEPLREPAVVADAEALEQCLEALHHQPETESH